MSEAESGVHCVGGGVDGSWGAGGSNGGEVGGHPDDCGGDGASGGSGSEGGAGGTRQKSHARHLHRPQFAAASLPEGVMQQGVTGQGEGVT